MKLNCVALDDEPIALEIIKQFCARLKDVDVEVFSEPELAARHINESKPDVVFLDIEMNDTNGIIFAKSLPADTCIIITSAYMQYAVDGYNIDAVDFLHKPFSFDRFRQALERARRRLGQTPLPSGESKYIIVKQDYNNVRIDISNIKYVEAMENYSKIFLLDGKVIIAHNSLKNISEMMPEGFFVRIHRSYIVPKTQVKSFSRQGVRLQDDTSLPVGRQFASQLFTSFAGNTDNQNQN